MTVITPDFALIQKTNLAAPINVVAGAQTAKDEEEGFRYVLGDTTDLATAQEEVYVQELLR